MVIFINFPIYYCAISFNFYGETTLLKQSIRFHLGTCILCDYMLEEYCLVFIESNPWHINFLSIAYRMWCSWHVIIYFNAVY